MRTNQGTSFAGDLGWTQRAKEAPDEREAVLVCAAEPLGAALAAVARRLGYEPHVSATPLGAIAALEDARVRIRHAVISSAFDCGRGMHELITDEYPHVSPVLLCA